MVERRNQGQRRLETRAALVSAARGLFAGQGYAATGTPEIVAAAGVTRGALYHHFADKAELFATVVEEEHMLLAMALNRGTEGDDEPGPVKALVGIGEAFVEAMQEAGRRQILLIDAPTVLGRTALDAIGERHGLKLVRDAAEAAIEAKAIRDLPVGALTSLLVAQCERAALAPPEESADYRKTMKALIRGLKT